MFHSSSGNDVINWPIHVLFPYKGNRFRAATRIYYIIHLQENSVLLVLVLLQTSKFQFCFGTYLALEKNQV